MSARDIFTKYPSRMSHYRFELFARTIAGGIPSGPDVIRKWIETRIKAGDAVIQGIIEETIDATKWREDLSTSERAAMTIDAVEKQIKSIDTFKRVDGELVYEGRCMKAALVEAAHVCYPGSTFPTGVRPGGISNAKGFKSWFIEMVEAPDDYYPLGRSVPDVEAEERVKHIQTGRVPRSVVTVLDLVKDVTIRGTIQIMDDGIPQGVWREIWEYVETGGIGSDRARGDGRCDLRLWEKMK